MPLRLILERLFKFSTMNFQSIESKTLLKAQELSVLNSKRYLAESQTVFNMNSFGHSKSLAILGIEEFGKSIGYGLLSNYKTFPFSSRITFNPQNLLNSIQRNHLTKQDIAIIFKALNELKSEDLYNYRKGLDNNEIQLKYDNKSKRFQNSPLELFQNKGSEIKIEDLDQIKQRGLYVEIDDNNTINDPNNSNPLEAKKYIKLLKQLLNK